ncbi:MAG: GxxExxY protein [Limisphaerales bacterium]
MKGPMDPLSYAVIGEAMAVHRELGPGVREEFYHRRLAARLRAIGVEHFSKPRRELLHRDFVADVFEPDMVIPSGLVLELKHLLGGFAAEHFVQLKCYLKLWRVRAGLLFNFGKEKLVTQRYLYDDPGIARIDAATLLAGLSAGTTVRPTTEAACRSLARVLAEHGCGYRDTTYNGLLRADLAADGVNCLLNPRASVAVAGEVLGESQFLGCIVGQSLLVKPLSQRGGIRAADLAVVQTWLRLLGLSAGLVAHFTKNSLEVRWVDPSTRPLQS